MLIFGSPPKARAARTPGGRLVNALREAVEKAGLALQRRLASDCSRPAAGFALCLCSCDPALALWEKQVSAAFRVLVLCLWQEKVRVGPCNVRHVTFDLIVRACNACPSVYAGVRMCIRIYMRVRKYLWVVGSMYIYLSFVRRKKKKENERRRERYIYICVCV